MRLMYDSVDPAAVPKRKTVAAYVNGDYAWTRWEEAQFPALIRISVMPGMPEAAKAARALDVERYDATTADIVPFVQARKALGHEDATIYMDLSTAAELPADVLGQIPRLWLAWWWGRPGYPRLGEVAAQVQDRIPAEKIWACQFASHADYDVSVIYGRQDFSR